MSRKRNYTGFTIVELLIVIVVIGILAAISVVAYNRVQDRANTAKNVSNARSYVSAFTLLRHDGDIPGGVYCLGDPAAYSAGTCTMMGANGVVDTAVNQKLAAVGASANARMNPAWHSGQMMYHGNWFGQNKQVLIYAVSPTQNCGLSNVLSTPYDNMTVSGAPYTSRPSNNAHTLCFISLN